MGPGMPTPPAQGDDPGMALMAALAAAKKKKPREGAQQLGTPPQAPGGAIMGSLSTTRVGY